MQRLSIFIFLLLNLLLLNLVACASKTPQLDKAGLEKYPQCYSINPKISAKCIEKNDAGENVTASQLENTAYPGQY